MRIFVGLLLASGCVINTESVTDYNDSIANSARSIAINGLTTEPSGHVYAQVLTSLYTSARDPAATWQSIGAFTASATGTTSGSQDYYGWNGALTNFTQNTWPAGGVARVRILYDIDGDIRGSTPLPDAPRIPGARLSGFEDRAHLGDHLSPGRRCVRPGEKRCAVSWSRPVLPRPAAMKLRNSMA
jgi:hypothetical protein